MKVYISEALKSFWYYFVNKSEQWKSLTFSIPNAGPHRETTNQPNHMR